MHGRSSNIEQTLVFTPNDITLFDRYETFRFLALSLVQREG